MPSVIYLQAWWPVKLLLQHITNDSCIQLLSKLGTYRTTAREEFLTHRKLRFIPPHKQTLTSSSSPFSPSRLCRIWACGEGSVTYFKNQKLGAYCKPGNSYIRRQIQPEVDAPILLHVGGRQQGWTLFVRSHSLENQLRSKHESLWKAWPVSSPWDSLCQSFSICLTGNHSGWNIPEIVLNGKTGLQFLTEPLFAEIFVMSSTSCSSRKDGERHQHRYLWKVLLIPGKVFH